MIDLSRFFVKYRWFITIIGLLLIVQIFLAVKLVVYHNNYEDPDGSGPRSFKWAGRLLSDPSDDAVRKGAKGAVGHTGKDGLTESPKSATTVSHPLALDLSTLSFLPNCSITLKESVSAINRAKTQTCKRQLADTACKIVEDTLYVKSLPRFCTNKVTIFGKYHGCYKDDKKKRILPDYFVMLKDNNSPKTCADLCLQSGFQYAGVQYGVECFCGNSLPQSSLQLPPSSCNMKCPVAPEFQEVPSDILISSEDDWMQLNCGGYYAMNIFETGVLQDLNGKLPIEGLENFPSSAGKLTAESEVRVVYFLTLNGRAIRQVYRLIKALFLERHYFYIHIDARQDYLYRELLVLSKQLPRNVRFMVNRKATIWGGASLLTVLLNGMEDLTNHAKEWGWEWDYVINLSESDFPLKSTEKLEYFLSVNKGKNFLKSHGRDVQKFIQKQGLDKTFDECEYRMWRLGDRKLPSGIFIDGGSDWIALHKTFVKYIVKSNDELVSGLKGVFKQTLLPAESFFHTLLRNSEMCDTFVDNNLHVTNWKRKLGCKCQYKNVVDWCGCSPNDFRMADWNRLQMTESRLMFFGRKFEAIVNQGIINQLETWLYPERFEKHYPTMDSFWLSLYHHHDISPKPDDGLVTLGHSLSRISASQFKSKFIPEITIPGSTEQTANIQVDTNLLEMSVYKQGDSFEGLLVRFQLYTEVNKQQISLELETWVKLETILDVADNEAVTEMQSRLRDVRVGGDYDQKEQIFRNFAGSLSPFSEPTLAYSVYANESFNLSVLWIDPLKNVQSIMNVTHTDGTTANFAKPTLKSPLLPGNWTVNIMTPSRSLLYTVKFLVLPLELYEGNFLTTSDESWINGRAFNDTNTSQHLQEWINELVSKYYVIQDYCIVSEATRSILMDWNSKWKNANNLNAGGFLDLSMCDHTQWSSQYPDPKSTITGIDPSTGRLVP